MPIMSPGTNYAALSAMLTPALFMTANGSLIISTSNRMSRIVDRIRVLIDLADRLDRGASDLDYPERRRAYVAEELQHLEWRSDRVRIVMTLLYTALRTYVVTSLALAADVLLGSRFHAVPTLLAVVGVGLMLVACVNLIREALRALGSNRQDLTFHRELLAFRGNDRRANQGADPAPPNP